MTQRRWKLSAAQRAEMWNLWKAGQSLHSIGRTLGKSHVVIQFLLARHGGDRSAGAAPIADRTHPSGTGRHLARNRVRPVAPDPGPAFAARRVDRKPGSGPPWRARAVSSQRSRSAGVGIGFAPQALPAGSPQQAL